MQLKGKICLVTGGTNGIGKASAIQLAKMGAEVVILGRNPEKGAATVAEVKESCGHERVSFLQCNLASQADIRRAAQDYLDTGKPLDILLNNAGIINLERKVTEDGLEETWAVNHLAYFLLTHLLLDRIKESDYARIVNVSSGAYKFASKGIQWDDIQFERTPYKGFPVYGQSKLANILFTQELARQLEGTGVTVNALHPGGVRTGLGQNNQAFVLKLLAKVLMLFLKSSDNGAKTSVFLCSSEEAGKHSGDYWANCKVEKLPAYAKDKEAAQRLWELSLQQTGLAE
ncbi:MAG: SDR family oxidoreductase [Deltaproteobacteria bacterium]|nr:MAG: SDR family oxidoreductase [Deltaproteobacteria bacterium]